MKCARLRPKRDSNQLNKEQEFGNIPGETPLGRQSTSTGWALAKYRGRACLRPVIFFTQPGELPSPPGQALGKMSPDLPTLTASRSPSETVEQRGQSEGRPVGPHQHPLEPWVGMGELDSNAERVAWEVVRFGKCLRIGSQYYPRTRKLPDLLWIRERKITEFSALETLPGIFPSQFMDESQSFPSLHFD